MTQRSTSTSTVPRTAAATSARRRKATRRLLEDLLWRLDDLSDEHLVATIGVLAEELRTREALTDSATAWRDEIPQACAEFGTAVPNSSEGAHMVRTPGGERVA